MVMMMTKKIGGGGEGGSSSNSNSSNSNRSFQTQTTNKQCLWRRRRWQTTQIVSIVIVFSLLVVIFIQLQTSFRTSLNIFSLLSVIDDSATAATTTEQQLPPPPPGPPSETTTMTSKNISSLKSSLQQQQQQQQQGEIKDVARTTTRRRENENINDYYNDGTYFSACLIIMDDNHFLIEWLAYHYMKLPLRRLIVAIDNRSKYSPLSILQRYTTNTNDFKPLMNITIWQDEDYMPSPPPPTSKSTSSTNHNKFYNNQTDIGTKFIRRQIIFNSQCLKQLTKENDSTSWVLMIDTDEFLVPNYNADIGTGVRIKNLPNPNQFKYNNLTSIPNHTNTSSSSRSKSNSHSDGSTTTTTGILNNVVIFENRTILSMIKQQRTIWKMGTMMSSPSCIVLPRLRFGIKESKLEEIQHLVPSRYFNGQDFMTFRWRWRARSKFRGNQPNVHNGPPKGMVNVRYITNPTTMLHPSQLGVHQPVKALCHDKYHSTSHNNAAFVVHHYPGTLEQWTFRNDARNWTRTNDTYKGFEKRSRRVDDTIRPWLHDFCQIGGGGGGVELAQKLLEGVGQLPSLKES